MLDFPLLSVMTFLPLAGVFFLFSIQGEAQAVARNSKYVALLTSVANLILGLYL